MGKLIDHAGAALVSTDGLSSPALNLAWEIAKTFVR